MRTFRFLLLASTACLLPLGAQAQAIDEAGAQQVEAQFNALLDQALSGNEDVSYSYRGTVDAVPSGDHYAVAVPPLVVTIDRDVEIELPAYSAEVRPLAQGWTRTDWDLPGTLSARNPRGDERIDVRYTSTGNHLIYAPQYTMALGGNVVLETISADVIGVDQQSGTITADSLALQIDSAASANGAADSFDSTSRVALAGFALDFPEQRARVALGRLALEGGTQRQRLDLFAGLQEIVRGVDPESQAFGELLLARLAETREENWIGAFSAAFTLEDFTLQTPDVSGSLAQASLGFDVDDLDAEASQARVSLAMTDLASAQLPPQMAQVVPTTVRLELGATGAPFRALLDQVYDALEAAGTPEVGPKGRRMGTGGSAADAMRALDPMSLLATLLESDAELQISDVYLEAPIGYITASGTVDPDPQATLQATAQLDVTVSGLPEMIAFAQAMGGDAAQAAGLASAIAAMGRDGTDPQGRPVKDFQLQVTPEGQVLLNGNDMSAMMGLFRP